MIRDVELFHPYQEHGVYAAAQNYLDEVGHVFLHSSGF